jgi:hypothetical protein
MAIWSALLSQGCAPSTYEWTVYLQSTACEVRKPDEPVSERRGASQKNASNKQTAKLLPLCWNDGKDRVGRPFIDIIGYGHEEIRVVHRDGLQPDHASSAIAGAIKSAGGQNLTLYVDTLRQRFFHAVKAEADTSIALFLEPKSEITIACRPAMDARPVTNDEEKRAMTSKMVKTDISDMCSTFAVISVSPSWKNRVWVTNFSTTRPTDPVIEIRLLDSAATPIGRIEEKSLANKNVLRAIIEADDTGLEEAFPVPNEHTIEIRAKNQSDRRIWGFVSLKFSCTLDWNRDSKLFTASTCYDDQRNLWSDWDDYWRIVKKQITPERHRSLGIEICLDPKTPFKETILGRMRD